MFHMYPVNCQECSTSMKSTAQNAPPLQSQRPRMFHLYKVSCPECSTCTQSTARMFHLYPVNCPECSTSTQSTHHNKSVELPVCPVDVVLKHGQGERVVERPVRPENNPVVLALVRDAVYGVWPACTGWLQKSMYTCAPINQYTHRSTILQSPWFSQVAGLNLMVIKCVLEYKAERSWGVTILATSWV